MEATIHIKKASNGLIVTTTYGTGLTANEVISLYLDYPAMERAVAEQLEFFKPCPTPSKA